jgi:hypothetical protein
VTQDAPARLHLVTDNHVVTDPVPDVVTGDRVEPTGPTARLVHPLALAAVGAGLTVVLALLGRQPWQLPQRDGSGVTAVPQSLVTFLLLSALICVWVAGRLVRPAETLRSTGAAQLWWALVAGAALVSLAADLSLASFAGTGQRPTDLLLRCAVPLVPAVLAGVLARNDGRAARIRVALGTGLVTLPLGALGWALLSSPDLSAAGLGDVLAMTGIAGVAPLILAVAFVAADRRGRPAS